MSIAEVLASIVERACHYVPEKSVGVSNVKRFKGTYQTFEKSLPKVELSGVDKVFPNEVLTSVKKVASVASDLVRNCLIYFVKAVGCQFVWLIVL